jgi:hypothetical protein
LVFNIVILLTRTQYSREGKAKLLLSCSLLCVICWGIACDKGENALSEIAAIARIVKNRSADWPRLEKGQRISYITMIADESL